MSFNNYSETMSDKEVRAAYELLREQLANLANHCHDSNMDIMENAIDEMCDGRKVNFKKLAQPTRFFECNGNMVCVNDASSIANFRFSDGSMSPMIELTASKIAGLFA